MSKFQKALLGAFCAGVLLCGLGAGIAFSELSALNYGGKTILGVQEMVTKDLEIALDQVNGSYQVSGGYYDSRPSEILLDESVPEGTVRFQVTYNANRVEPMVYVDEKEKYVGLDWYWESVDEVEMFFAVKEQFLAELKEGVLSSYEVEDIAEINIYIHPAMEGQISLIL